MPTRPEPLPEGGVCATKARKPTPAPARTQPPKARGNPPHHLQSLTSNPDSSTDSQDEDDGFETVRRSRHRLPRNPKNRGGRSPARRPRSRSPSHHQPPDNLRGPRNRHQPPSTNPGRLLDYALKSRILLRLPLPLPPPPLPHNPPGTHPWPHSPLPTCIKNSRQESLRSSPS
ncbi:proline-rich receptor-like protein kinase PERK9 [Homalodisca vitripennis]|uniref:proline-rich receptor-like protein kinase PERK9 n=1 Tax=Homalodisca vitripennis TaxID=197043 RepID=UPI001EEC88BF|nr:proline-rich receptor-like protein kinase PERK9 [Homalodisca vitripennis]